ncbi:MAG: phage portal protein [Oscillospiraceae bacterium]|nr:phage portal protein [Oscillospiraceae bacterium]
MKVKPQARPMARDKPVAQKRSVVWLTDAQGFETLKCQGYRSLADSPEVSTAVNTIARLIGAMTIHLMRNEDAGDVRIRNELSDLVDIEPNRYMSRSNFIQWIVRTMLLEGRGNAVVWPRTEGGRLRELIPIPPAFTAFVPDGAFGYFVEIAGQPYDPESLLHFAANPGSYYPWLGTGFALTLADVANNLKQAATTEKGFMESKWKPSLIIKVDGMFDELGNPIKRSKLLADYIETTEAGQPWMIPAEQFQVQEVKPLTLSDLALADFVKIDKKTVATILGVPPFVLGVDEFKRDEWNSFINTTIMPLAQILQQELTRKLLDDPALFFRFNPRSLLNYSMDELVKAGGEMVDRMAMRRNEWRDWMGLEPDPDMDELLALENYIPASRLGDQTKLTGGGESK